MSTISRRLPGTNKTVLAAIRAAKLKSDSQPPADDTLRAATKAALNAQAAPLVAADQARNVAKAAQVTATEAKNDERKTMRTLAVQFIALVNARVVRGAMPAGERAYYGLDTNTGN